MRSGPKADAAQRATQRPLGRRTTSGGLCFVSLRASAHAALELTRFELQPSTTCAFVRKCPAWLTKKPVPKPVPEDDPCSFGSGARGAGDWGATGFGGKLATLWSAGSRFGVVLSSARGSECWASAARAMLRPARADACCGSIAGAASKLASARSPLPKPTLRKAERHWGAGRLRAHPKHRIGDPYA